MGEVQIDSNSCSISLNWDAPFSQNVTGIDPDVWYSVNITCLNNTTGAVYDPVPCNDCEHLNDSSYEFTPQASSCTWYQFEVTAYNALGPGICRNIPQCMFISFSFRVSVDWMVLAKHYWCKMLRTGSAKVCDATIVNPFPTSFILWVMHAIMKVNAILWVSRVNPPSPEINEMHL